MLFIIAIMYIAYIIGNFQYTKKDFKKRIINNKIIYSMEKPSSFGHYFIKSKHINKIIFIENPLYRKNMIPLHILIIFGGISLFWITFFRNSELKFEFITLAVFITFFTLYGRMVFESAFILLIIATDSKIFTTFKLFISDKPILKEFSLIPVKIIVIVSSLFLIIILPIYIFTFFHQKCFLPENLKNLKYIESSLNAKDYNQSKISYFNDKYIFIEHIKDGNSTIEILKFEKLFEENDDKPLFFFPFPHPIFQ